MVHNPAENQGRALQELVRKQAEKIDIRGNNVPQVYVYAPNVAPPVSNLGAHIEAFPSAFISDLSQGQKEALAAYIVAVSTLPNEILARHNQDFWVGAGGGALIGAGTGAWGQADHVWKTKKVDRRTVLTMGAATGAAAILGAYGWPGLAGDMSADAAKKAVVGLALSLHPHREDFYQLFGKIIDRARASDEAGPNELVTSFAATRELFRTTPIQDLSAIERSRP